MNLFLGIANIYRPAATYRGSDLLKARTTRLSAAVTRKFAIFHQWDSLKKNPDSLPSLAQLLDFLSQGLKPKQQTERKFREAGALLLRECFSARSARKLIELVERSLMEKELLNLNLGLKEALKKCFAITQEGVKGDIHIPFHTAWLPALGTLLTMYRRSLRDLASLEAPDRKVTRSSIRKGFLVETDVKFSQSSVVSSLPKILSEIPTDPEEFKKY